MTTSRRRASARARMATAVLATVLGTTLVACGSSGTSSSSPGSTPGGTAGATTPPATATEATGLPVLTIEVKEDQGVYSFDAPSSVPSGWVEVDLVNEGTLAHQAGVGHPTAGRTADDIEAAINAGGANAALPLLALDGGPNTVAAGATQRTIVWLEPGEHVLYCMVADLGDGKPHVEHGMVAKFAVTGPSGESATSGSSASTAASATSGSTPGTAPARPSKDPVTVAGTVTLRDYGFDLPKGFGAPGWYKVVNAGPQPHELTLLALKPDTTADQAKKYLITASEAAASSTTTLTPPKAPPFTDAGGFGAIDAGGVGYVEIGLTTGDYAALCFVPDVPFAGRSTPPDFQPHLAHGMFQPFTVS